MNSRFNDRKIRHLGHRGDDYNRVTSSDLGLYYADTQLCSVLSVSKAKDVFIQDNVGKSNKLTIRLVIGGAEIARPDIARPDKTAPCPLR